MNSVQHDTHSGLSLPGKNYSSKAIGADPIVTKQDDIFESKMSQKRQKIGTNLMSIADHCAVLDRIFSLTPPQVRTATMQTNQKMCAAVKASINYQYDRFSYWIHNSFDEKTFLQQITNPNYQEIVRAIKELTLHSVDDSFSHGFFKTIANHCPNLQKLKIITKSLQGFDSLVCLKNLKSLSIHQNMLVSPQLSNILSLQRQDVIEIIAAMTGLERLELVIENSYSKPKDSDLYCGSFNLESLAYLAALKSLTVKSNTFFSVSEKVFQKNLVFLEIEVEDLASHYTQNLRRILNQVHTYCPNLQSLTIKLPRNGDFSFSSLNCQNLTHLECDFSYIPRNLSCCKLPQLQSLTLFCEKRNDNNSSFFLKELLFFFAHLNQYHQLTALNLVDFPWCIQFFNLNFINASILKKLVVVDPFSNFVFPNKLNNLECFVFRIDETGCGNFRFQFLKECTKLKILFLDLLNQDERTSQIVDLNLAEWDFSNLESLTLIGSFFKNNDLRVAWNAEPLQYLSLQKTQCSHLARVKNWHYLRELYLKKNHFNSNGLIFMQQNNPLEILLLEEKNIVTLRTMNLQNCYKLILANTPQFLLNQICSDWSKFLPVLRRLQINNRFFIKNNDNTIVPSYRPLSLLAYVQENFSEKKIKIEAGVGF